MNDLPNRVSFYPYDFPELSNQSALREKLCNDLTVVALAAMTGISGPERKMNTTQPTIDQRRKIGRRSMSNLVYIDNQQILLSPIESDLGSPFNEQAYAGYAPQH